MSTTNPRTIQTDRSTAAWLPQSSMYFLAWLLVLRVFDPIDAMPVDSKHNDLVVAKTKSSTYLANRGYGSPHKSTGGTVVSHVVRFEETHRRQHVGPIVGGTIAAGIILGLTVFMCFRIYKEYMTYRTGMNPTTDTSIHTRENKDSFRNKLPRVGSLVDRAGFCCRKVVNLTTSDSASDLSFGNLETVEQAGTVVVIPGPAIPLKAASFLGVKLDDSNDQSVPIPVATRPLLTAAAPIVPPLPPQPLPPPSLHLPWSRRCSTSTMSTLGRELLEDTMHLPSPYKYSIHNQLPQRPPRPPRTPSPPRHLLTAGEQGLDMRYFVPAFSPGGQLQNPTSPDGTLGMETMHHGAWNRTRYSMGDNMI
ncbi:hypothetical protein EDB81DRAFT_897779 [Dactylonectria macrodidyma]|uniref:Uncharacterized protein n=1 Tax=Dactylonectria macrodidyma TaxID=307937 RepID=A0A9P9JNU1_9HYPO|nr:hypothetical protein EDB81DRAFT_897779 [Dactylonectria macrodidyma]